jgi:hypothetical protein
VAQPVRSINAGDAEQLEELQPSDLGSYMMIYIC